MCNNNKFIHPTSTKQKKEWLNKYMVTAGIINKDGEVEENLKDQLDSPSYALKLDHFQFHNTNDDDDKIVGKNLTVRNARNVKEKDPEEKTIRSLNHEIFEDVSHKTFLGIQSTFEMYGYVTWNTLTKMGFWDKVGEKDHQHLKNFFDVKEKNKEEEVEEEEVEEEEVEEEETEEEIEPSGKEVISLEHTFFYNLKRRLYQKVDDLLKEKGCITYKLLKESLIWDEFSKEEKNSLIDILFDYCELPKELEDEYQFKVKTLKKTSLFDDLNGVVTVPNILEIRNIFDDGKEELYFEDVTTVYDKLNDDERKNVEIFFGLKANNECIGQKRKFEGVDDFSSSSTRNDSVYDTPISNLTENSGTTMNSGNIRTTSSAVARSLESSIFGNNNTSSSGTNKRERKGKKTIQMKGGFIAQSSEQQSVKGTFKSIQTSISSIVEFSGKGLFITKVDLLARNAAGQYFAWQPFYLKDTCEKIVNLMMTKGDLFREEDFGFHFLAYNRCLKPGSHEYFKSRDFSIFDLFMVIEVKDDKFDRWYEMNDIGRKNFLEEVSTTILKNIFSHEQFEYEYVNCFEKKEFEKRNNSERIGDRTPMSTFHEYPKKMKKSYISSMAKRIASTTSITSEFFLKLKEAEYECVHGLRVYNCMVPSDIQHLMDAARVPTEPKIDPDHEKVFETKLWENKKKE